MGGIRGELVFCPKCGNRVCVLAGLIEYHKVTPRGKRKAIECPGYGMIVDINFYPSSWSK